jgi:catechol 2,3-dioxygenase-like lactoylglutathione lyase family enzyme
MINGAHAILYSKNAEADRAFFRDILGFKHVDVGHGWLIFALPPSELAVHPAEEDEKHELYLMCEDINEFHSEMKREHIECSDIVTAGWGLITHVKLPGGGKLGVYQPRHERP